MEFIVYTYELGFVPQLFSKEHRNEHKGNEISARFGAFVPPPPPSPSTLNAEMQPFHLRARFPDSRLSRLIDLVSTRCHNGKYTRLLSPAFSFPFHPSLSLSLFLFSSPHVCRCIDASEFRFPFTNRTEKRRYRLTGRAWPRRDGTGR